METQVLTKEQSQERARTFLEEKFGPGSFSLKEELTVETTEHWVIFWTSGQNGANSAHAAGSCPPLLVDRQSGEVQMTLTAAQPGSGGSPRSEGDVTHGS